MLSKHNSKKIKARVYTPKQHHITNKALSPDALEIVDALSRRGFLSYIVGGSIRDLYLGYKPKDFDIVTSARPEQVRSIFNGNCWVIGRRFRLAHVRIGKNIIEVSTFRSNKSESDCLTIRDNKWGSAPEDALKRDLTINGLFYDPMTESIIDYVDGLSDMNNQILKVIGDPETRFKQDPVRMLRIVKFKAKLGFDIDPIAIDALIRSRSEIYKSSPYRIFEELMKVLDSGFCANFIKTTAQVMILDDILPVLNSLLKQNIDSSHMVMANLETVDHIINHHPHIRLCKNTILTSIVSPFINHKSNIDVIHKKVCHILKGPFFLREKTKEQVVSILDARNKIINQKVNYKRDTKKEHISNAIKLIEIERLACQL